MGNGQFSGCCVREERVHCVTIRGDAIPIMYSMYPVYLSFVIIPVCCIRIIVHALFISYIVIDMRTSLLGLNDERGTQSLRLDYPLN